MTSTQPLQRLEVPLRKKAAAAWLVACFAALVGCFSLFQQAPWLGGTVGAMSAAMILFLASVIASTQPGLVLDSEALSISNKVGMGGKVPWQDIKSISVVQNPASNTWFLLVKVRDPERYALQGSAASRMLRSIGSASVGSSVYANLKLIDYERGALEIVANAFCNKYGKGSE